MFGLAGAITSSGRWIWNNKVKVGAGVIVASGGVYYAYHRATKALSDQFTSTLRSQFLEQRKESFFESIDYENTIKREFRWLKNSLQLCIPCPTQEEIGAATRGATKEEKQAFWEALKETNVTRLFVVVYSQILFSLTMRVHLTLIARYIYLSTADEEGQNSDSEMASLFELDDSVQLAFLAQARFVLEGGLEHLRNHVECAVHDVLQEWSIVTPATREDLKSIFAQIRKQIEREDRNGSVLTQFTLPPEQEEGDLHLTETDRPTSRHLENEARNIFESRDFAALLQQTLNGAFDLLDGMVALRFDSRRVQAGKADDEANQFALPFAKLIPLVSNLTNELQESNNSLLHYTLHGRMLDEMAHQVYDVSVPGI